MNWRDKIACRNTDPEVFFPVAVEGTPAFARQAARALAVCARCPVRRECYDDALSTGAAGIRGGTTEQQRRNVGHAVAACPTPGQHTPNKPID